MGTTKSSFELRVSSGARIKSQWSTGRLPQKRRGLWVVLLGPDGVGKSTVIEAIGDGVAAGFAGCDSFHLRPALFRQGNSRAANCNPHGQQPRGLVVTLLKLGYLLAANWLGHLMMVRPGVARGKLVLFDRYFPDYVVDPKRYRVPSSCARLVKFVARLVPQPDLYILLHASRDVLLRRKQELAATEVERQRKAYRELVAGLGESVVVNTSRAAAVVLDRVVTCIVERHLAVKRQLAEAA